MSNRFLAAGFEPAILACSDNPGRDGYIAQRLGMGFHIHPEATPAEWDALTEALADETAAVAGISPREPELSAEEHIARRRAERDMLLKLCDWTQLPDTLPGAKAQKAAWALYRQQLRDLDMTATDWPVAPLDEGVAG